MKARLPRGSVEAKTMHYLSDGLVGKNNLGGFQFRTTRGPCFGANIFSTLEKVIDLVNIRIVQQITVIISHWRWRLDYFKVETNLKLT